MKRLVKMLAAVVLVAGLSSVARAVNFSGISLAVEVTGALELTLTSTMTSFSPVAPGASAVSSPAIGVTNNAVGIIETFSLQSFNSGTWTLSPSNGPNLFSVKGLFNSAAPVSGSFNLTDSLTTSSVKATSAGGAGVYEGDQSGAVVSPGESRNLWFRFDAPTQLSTFGARVLTVTIVAELP